MWTNLTVHLEKMKMRFSNQYAGWIWLPDTAQTYQFACCLHFKQRIDKMRTQSNYTLGKTDQLGCTNVKHIQVFPIRSDHSVWSICSALAFIEMLRWCIYQVEETHTNECIKRYSAKRILPITHLVNVVYSNKMGFSLTNLKSLRTVFLSITFFRISDASVWRCFSCFSCITDWDNMFITVNRFNCNSSNSSISKTNSSNLSTIIRKRSNQSGTSSALKWLLQIRLAIGLAGLTGEPIWLVVTARARH